MAHREFSKEIKINLQFFFYCLIILLASKNAGLAQLVEHLICNQRVEGSSPLAGTSLSGSSSVVEHHLAKVGVAGSNPVFRF